MTSVEGMTDTYHVAADTAGTYDAPVWASTLLFSGIVPSFLPAVFQPTFLGSLHRPIGVRHIVTAKLAALENLRDGWLGPGSLRPAPASLRNYRIFLEALGEVTLDAEAVATAEGTVRVEWEIDRGRERVIEFGTEDDAWLYDSGEDTGPFASNVETDDDDETLVAPFDVDRVVEFFSRSVR